MIKEFSAHHMKTEQIKIDPELSQVVWARGIRSPPRKIRVKMAKTDDGYVMVSPYEEEVKAKAEDKPKKDKKADAKAEEKVEETAEEKTEAAPKEEKKEKAKKSEAKPAKKAAKPKSKKK